MSERSTRGENVRAGAEFAHQIMSFRGKYNALLGALATVGTEVERVRTKENDPDIDPYTFIRGAHHVFVIPPQEVELQEIEGEFNGALPGTAPYTLFREALRARYNESEVRTTITIGYDDSNNVPSMRVEDTGEIPSPEVTRMLDLAVDPQETPARN